MISVCPLIRERAFSRHTVVLALVSLGVEHAHALVDHVLLSVRVHNVTGLAGYKDLRVSRRLLEALVSLLAALEGLPVVVLLCGVVADHVELLVTRRHLLDKALSYGVAASDLGHELRVVRVDVGDDRLLARLVVDYGGTSLGLQGHGHGHRRCLGLSAVLSVEVLLLNCAFV